MQETRGTPLRPIGLFAMTAATVVAVDQLTKWWAVAYLKGREPVHAFGGLIGLQYLRNPGAALGTGAGYTIVLSIIALVVVVVLIWQAPRMRDPWWAIGLGLFLGGAIGNLLDRMFREPGFLRGHVVDFVNYADLFVGNVADMALTAAAVTIIVRSWQGVRLDGTASPKESSDG